MAFITKIKDYIKDKNNYDLSSDYLTVIFPNKRAAYMLREELKKDYDKNIWLPQMLSIQEAMSLWSGIQLVDNIDVIFELMKVMDKKNDIDKSKLFSLASQIVKDFDEIDQYAVNAKNLFDYVKDVKEIENWNKPTEKAYLQFFASLNEYYIKLRKELMNDNCGYYGLITRKLYELSREELNNIIGDKKIIFAGFNAMTTTEESIIVRLIESGKAVLLWDLDKYYFEDEKQEAGLFARQFFKKHKNMEPNFLSDSFLTGEKIINVIGVSGSTVQTNALHIKLNDEINENGNKAVVLADETLLIPVLNSIPSDSKKPQITMGYPFSSTIVNQFINLLFAFKNNRNREKRTYFWNLKRLLDTEFIKNIFNHDEMSALTKFIDYYAKNSIYYVETDDIDKFFNTNDSLRKFLLSICEAWDSPQKYICSMKMLLSDISNIISDCEEKYFIKNQIRLAGKIVNKLEKLFNKYESILQIHDMEVLFKQAAHEMSIKLDGDSEGLQIMGLLETRNLDFDIVHILSVNEGVLPQSKNTSSLIPFDLRKHYGLPVYTNKQAVYAYHFYRLIQNAKRVNIYYNILADGMGEGEPSRFILQLLHEIPQKKSNITINEITYKNPDINTYPIANLEVEKTEEIMNKIRGIISGTNTYGEKKGLSPTSISCYLSCPLKFYLKYVENIRDNTSKETIQSNVIGSIIHSFLEFLYKEFGDSVIDYEIYNAKTTEEKYKELFEKAIIENDFANGLPETGFNYLNHIMIKKLIDNFIDYEKAFLKEGNTLKIIGLEEYLTYTLKIDDTEVNMIGYADRIDTINGKIRILDYKTGAIKDDDVTIKDKYSHISELPEKSLQLLIYKYLYAKKQKIDTENIESAILALIKIKNILFPLVNQSETFNDSNLIQNCDTFFEEVFRELLNPDVPFVQTADEAKCKNCDFLDICKRKPKSW